MFKRHPYLYFTRFKLLSKNVDKHQIFNDSYNTINKPSDIPELFFEVNKLIFTSQETITDLEKIKVISLWLVNHIKGGPGLSMSSKQALKTMIAGEGGVCSDMAQIFNNFCVINNLKVREWGVTLIPFNTNYGGHSFNEVFIKELNKWVFIDVANCLMFYSVSSNLSLSVIELFELARMKQCPKPYFFNKKQKFKEKIIDNYYFNVEAAPFLICNYSTNTYDYFLDKFRPSIPVFIIHFMIFSLGKSYCYKFPIDDYKKIFS